MRRPTTLTLKSIEEEAADCRAAWADSKVGDLGLHIHHEVVCEPLLEPVENRIEYILREKPDSEQALRLRLMRPLWKTPPELHRASAEWNKAGTELHKADAEWRKASAEWNKAYAELHRADAERNKASAEWNKASAEWHKADAEWRKASAKWGKASAKWGKANHASNCVPGCTWNGRTIFP